MLVYLSAKLSRDRKVMGSFPVAQIFIYFCKIKIDFSFREIIGFQSNVGNLRCLLLTFRLNSVGLKNKALKTTTGLK